MPKVKTPEEPNPSAVAQHIASLEEELDTYRTEKQAIRQIIGQIGGMQDRKRDRLFNIGFVLLLVGLLISDILTHYKIVELLPFQISVEVAVLLVSIKIIWMIHKQAKVEHFQFWILNSIEFRLTAIGKQIKDIEKKVSEVEPKE